jgi:hypothetical protein
MSISTENSKLTAFISKGTEEDLQQYSKAIHSAINLYLCREPFLPINQDQAGNIYFLKWLDKCLIIEPSKEPGKTGQIICSIPNNDVCLLEAFIQSIDNVVKDFIMMMMNEKVGITVADNLARLYLIREALSPDFSEIRKSIIN